MPRLLSTTPSSAEHPPDPLPATSNTVVILAAMLCALICLVGLALVALCSWIRRRSSPPPPPPPPKKGLKKKAIRSLPKLLFGGERIADCPICLAEFVEGDEIRILPECGHGFHVGCVDTWLRAHSSCPSCRRVLVIPPPSDSDRAVDGGGKGGDGNRFLL